MRMDRLHAELTSLFTAAGIECADYDAALLIEECAGITRSERLLHGERELPPEISAAVRRLAERRIAREPLQYLIGKSYFMDLELAVTPAVLIPRPETELLVEWAIRNLPLNGKMADIGTGSGAIALAVAYERKDAVVTAVDISPEALSIAAANREKYSLAVRLLRSDLFSALKGETFDLVTANLPYVAEEEYRTLEPEVRCHEPKLALTAPEAGFALIRESVRQLPEFLNPGGSAIWELDPAQAQKLADLLKTNGFKTVTILEDYTHRARFVCAQI